ncbi:motility protein B [bacterium BMS3Bbin12]|nr:motility protein B [bacterium BMS3Abin12]GBE47489.1 motility protein B [bacterium BMS3Bbin12]GBE51152.1 motility protein B [bacterium BMS3Bbin13]
MYAPAQRLGARSFSVPIEPIPEDGDAGWLLSFADLVTLLLTVFVLLFAYSRVPAGTTGPPTSPVRPTPRVTTPALALPITMSHTAVAAVRKDPATHKPPARPAPAHAPSLSAKPAPEPAHVPTARVAPIPGLSRHAAPDAPLIMRTVPVIQVPYAPRPNTPSGRAAASDTTARPETHAPRVRAISILVPKDLRGKVEVMRSATAVNLIITDDLLYLAGDAQLSAAGRALLDRIAAMLERSRYAVSVEGYTDDTPIHTARFPSNWELSTARATTVARYLIRRGVAPARLSAIGYGDTRPRADNATASGRALNRRVTLVLHAKTPQPQPPPRRAQ